VAFSPTEGAVALGLSGGLNYLRVFAWSGSGFGSNIGFTATTAVNGVAFGRITP
jgi:hypothetical protein